MPKTKPARTTPRVEPGTRRQPRLRPSAPAAHGGTHTEHEDHPWTIRIADHPRRTDSREYIASRKNTNAMAKSEKNWFFGHEPYEDHHGGGLWVKDEDGWFVVRNLAGIEWSAQFCADPTKVDALRVNASGVCPFPRGGRRARHPRAVGHADHRCSRGRRMDRLDLQRQHGVARRTAHRCASERAVGSTTTPRRSPRSRCSSTTTSSCGRPMPGAKRLRSCRSHHAAATTARRSSPTPRQGRRSATRRRPPSTSIVHSSCPRTINSRPPRSTSST